VVRTATSAEPEAGRPARTKLALRAGLNRFVWDLRTESPIQVPGVLSTEGGTMGYRVAPGSYQVRLVVGKRTETRPLTVLVDPRTAPSPQTIGEQQRLLADILDRIDTIHRAAIRLRGVRDQLDALQKRLAGRPEADTVAAQAKPVVAAIDSLEGRLVDPKSRTFQDVVNYRNGLNDQFLELMGAIDGTDAPVTQGMKDRWTDLEVEWRALSPEVDRLLGPRLAALNGLIRSLSVPTVIPPATP